jgi:RNA polymerase sigma-32 factor
VAKKKTTRRAAPPKSKKASARPLTGYREVEGEIIETPVEAPALDDDRVRALETGLDSLVDAVDTNLPAATDTVARYMAELGRYPLLTREQERELAVRYRETGDAKAAERLVTSNLRFVVKVAAEYTKFGARLIDLVQEGNVGLMHAVKEFNPYKDVRLITYAVWWIRGYIQEYLMRHYSMVRIGTTSSQRKLFYQLQREREELERVGLDYGFKQLSGKLGIPTAEIRQMHARLSGRDVSLDAPVSEDGGARMMDLQSEVDPHRIDDELGAREEVAQLHEKIDQLRPSLNERELFLLEARVLADEPLTLQEIGDKYGTTREAVRQMEARLLGKIKRLVAPEE